MKKAISLFLAVLLLLLSSAGCNPSGSTVGSDDAVASGPEDQAREEAPLRLCADLRIGNFMEPSGSYESAIQLFLQSVEEKGGPKHVEYEVLPAEGAERETTLSRIRTEIMSGKGPDVFLCNCVSPGDTETQALFPFPRKIMGSGVFLPLDDLIPKAQFLEWEKLNPPVMEAGKAGQEQIVLPTAYSLPLSFFLRSDVEPYPEETTWAEAAKGDDPILAVSM